MTYSTFAVLCICLHFSNVCLTNRVYEFEKLENPQESSIGNKSTSKKKDEKVNNVVIKIFSYLDYSVYTNFLDIENDDEQKAEEAIRFHYAHLINGVRNLYKTINSSAYRYDVKTVKLIIVKTKVESITEYQDVKFGENVIDYAKALDAMKKWAIEHQHDLPVYGVFVLFTSYLDNGVPPAEGIAIRSSACLTEKNVAIIRWTSYRNHFINNVAHEIGHNLGAKHNGVGNVCLASNYHIMNPNVLGNDINNATFSHCSIKAFKTYLRSLSSSIKKSCLKKEPSYPVEKSLSKYLKIQLGERFTLDQQCQEMKGSQYRYCPGLDNDEDVCHTMSCGNIMTNECKYYKNRGAYNKSFCGHKKTCQDKICVDDADAKDEPCNTDAPLQIKYRGVIFSCADVAERLNLCYEPYFKRPCCKTCDAKLVKDKPADCLYGDSDTWFTFDAHSLTCKDFNTYPHMCKQYNGYCCETCGKLKYE